MISFASDYTEGCHPRILQRLVETNGEQTLGYGEDAYCQRARELIVQRLQAPQAHVHFFVGGTQVNTVAIKSILRPHEGVVCVQTGHINVHESGAIESTGHKVLVVDSPDGKMKPEALDKILSDYHNSPTYEHEVKPGLLYLSNTTETGSVYNKSELEAVCCVAKKWSLPVYLDGARLASALAAPGQTLRLEDLPQMVDAFTLGGTKNGLLFGEALVILNEAMKIDFRSIQKQQGALLAKGRLLGIQFETLFQDDLYLEIGLHENRQAQKLAEGMKALGVEFEQEPVSNQLFVRLDRSLLNLLSQKFIFEEQPTAEGMPVIRLCTSFATTDEAVSAWLEALEQAMKH